jgi:hypothetical protein
MDRRPLDAFDEPKIEELLGRSLGRLVKQDRLLFTHNANERSICFRLAYHLQFEFPDFDVDCEYNRNHLEENFRKAIDAYTLGKLTGGPEITDSDAITVFPDIIIHRRNTAENLLVIEAKKSNSRIKADEYDLHKLWVYRHCDKLKYRFARFIRFGTKGEKELILENRSI